MKDNKQQLLFIQSMFTKKPSNNPPVTINLKEKRQGIPYRIQVSNNTQGDFLVFKLIDASGQEGLWQTWDSPEEVENFFRTASFI